MRHRADRHARIPACKKAKDGASIEEVAQFVRDTRDHLCHWFTVDDLMFLFRGGRVSRTSAWAGTLLNIKPVLHVDNAGALIPMEKVRGRKKSIKALVDHMEKTAIDPKSQTIFITHGDCIEDVEALKAEITERFGITDFVVNYIDPVIGAHSGPTLAPFFVGTEKSAIERDADRVRYSAVDGIRSHQRRIITLI